ncbi:MAG: hypothetical protein V4544_07050 [Pseudomonadota bacterium]
MIISHVIPLYVSKGTIKISSEVKPLSIVQMNVKLNTSLLEKNAQATSENDAIDIEDIVNIGSDAQIDYQKIRVSGDLDFCHEHLFDIVI